MYTEGLIQNCQMIRERFPDAIIYAYLANDVHESFVTRLQTFNNVNIVHVSRKEGTFNSFDRFLAIDDKDVDIMFARDTDSRVHERDACCIEDFIRDNKALHVIRDSKHHWSRMMAGMFGIRKSEFPYLMKDLIADWQTNNTDTRYFCDQHFLNSTIYKLLNHSMLVHDRYNIFKDEYLTPFRFPIVEHRFIGQAHEFKEDGTELIVHTMDH